MTVAHSFMVIMTENEKMFVLFLLEFYLAYRLYHAYMCPFLMCLKMGMTVHAAPSMLQYHVDKDNLAQWHS